MQDIATLKTQVADLQRWRIDTDGHDDRQDKAIYKVESDVRDILTKFDNQSALLKWVLGFAVATFLSSGLDSIIWNIVHHFGGK